MRRAGVRAGLTALGMLWLLGGCSNVGAPAPSAAAAPAATAAAAEPSLHERLLVLDSHLDTPAKLVQPGFDITRRYDWARDYAQVDLPRMVEGGLDGGFWVIYTGQGPLTEEGYRAARDTALLRAVAIHKMTAANPDDFVLATEAAEAAPIVAAGGRVVYVSIENSYPLGTDVSLLETFYKLGVRMVGPVHFRNNQFADSSTDPDGQIWGGLSDLGRELVREANRLGMVLDGSHAHDDVVAQMLDLSETPIILSHSGAKAVYDHPRNLDDDLLRRVAEGGGVIQMNAFGGYLTALPQNPERQAALAALAAEMGPAGDLDEAGLEKMFEARRQIDAQFPAAQATFEDYMAHFLHTLKLVGVDHVGVGADWDGGGGVEGLQDVSALPLITERLLAEGYSPADLEKIWSGNMLRVLEAARLHALAAAES